MYAARFKMKMRSKNLPRLPINCIEDDLDSSLMLQLKQDAENKLRERGSQEDSLVQ